MLLSSPILLLVRVLGWDFQELGSVDHPGVLYGVRTLNVERSPSLTQHPSIPLLLFFQHLLCLAAPRDGCAV